jgi:hypothetical protein
VTGLHQSHEREVEYFTSRSLNISKASLCAQRPKVPLRDLSSENAKNLGDYAEWFYQDFTISAAAPSSRLSRHIEDDPA